MKLESDVSIATSIYSNSSMAGVVIDDGGPNDEVDEGDCGLYKRFSLSDSRQNSLSFLLPTSCNNEELIFDVKQPSLSSVNLTDSVCSNSTIGSLYNGYKSNQGLGISDNFVVKNGYDDVTLINDSEPEDMQDIGFSKSNENIVNSSDNIFKHLFDIEVDNSKQNLTRDSLIDPLTDNYRNMCTSTPLSSLCVNKKMLSISLQDMSTIDIFPLESKTNNAFSTETIQTQSMSSTTKSKDSGFQRSASCLSINSGNRSFNHVKSKVKQYIKEIKESEALRKKQKQLQANNSIDSSKNSSDAKSFVVNVLDVTSSGDRNEMVKTIGKLKDELKEKDTILNELQHNYNTLLGRYAEAINQIDLMRLRSSLNYDYHSDFTGEVTVNDYNNRNNSFLYCDNNRKDSGLFISNNNNDSNINPSYKNYNSPSQQILFQGSNFSSNPPVTNNQDSQPVSTVQRSEVSAFHPSLSNNIKDKKSPSDLYDYKNLSTVKRNNKTNNGNIVNSEEPKKENENESLKYNSFPTETQPVQSGSHSTSLQTSSSMKSVSLKPIVRMYSSSSRLDKIVSPLPTASSSLTSVFKPNNNKNRKSAVNRNLESNKRHTSKKYNYSLLTDNNSKDSCSKSGTLVCEDNELSVPYLNCQSISKLELPKVDPFEMVKKWQASLPTISLVRSQSSSSVGSSENVEIHRSSRRRSLDSKLDNDLVCKSSSKSHSEKKSSKKHSSKVKLVSDNHGNDFCVIPKCEQNLSSSSKHPRIYFDFYDTSKISSTVFDNKDRNKGIVGRTRNDKNVLKRTDALDLGEGCVNIREPNVNVDNENDSSLCIIKNKEDEQMLSGLDESSSMSSSILSSTINKDITDRNKNLHYTSLFNSKTKIQAETKNDPNDIFQNNCKKLSGFQGGIQNKTNIDSIKVSSQSSVDKITSSNREKRICYSLSAQFQIKSNEMDTQGIPVFPNINAWGSPKHITGSLKTTIDDTGTQQVADVKRIKSTKTNNKNSLLRQRKDSLRQYSEVVNNENGGSDVETYRSFVNVGTQVTDELSLKETTNTINYESPTSPRTQIQELEDADEYVRYIIQKVESIHGHLLRLQTNFINEVQYESS